MAMVLARIGQGFGVLSKAPKIGLYVTLEQLQLLRQIHAGQPPNSKLGGEMKRYRALKARGLVDANNKLTPDGTAFATFGDP